MPLKIGPKTPGRFGLGWSAIATTEAGEEYRVLMSPGRRIRIPYKPRGEGSHGYEWWGTVSHPKNGIVWHGRVNGSTGVRWMMEAAGLVELRPSEAKKKEKRAEFSRTLREQDYQRRTLK